VARPKKINTAEFFQDKKNTPPQKYVFYRQILTWLHYDMPRGHWVNYLESSFELDVRNLDKWLRKPLPKAFATTLDENPGLWCEAIQLLAAKPPFRPP
jgi:hypothetical protein